MRVDPGWFKAEIRRGWSVALEKHDPEKQGPHEIWSCDDKGELVLVDSSKCCLPHQQFGDRWNDDGNLLIPYHSAVQAATTWLCHGRPNIVGVLLVYDFQEILQHCTVNNCTFVHLRVESKKHPGTFYEMVDWKYEIRMPSVLTELELSS